MIKQYTDYINENLLKGKSKEEALKSVENKSIDEVIDMFIYNNYQFLKELPIYNNFLNNELGLTDRENAKLISEFSSVLLELTASGNESYLIILNDILSSKVFIELNDVYKSAQLFWFIMPIVTTTGKKSDIDIIKNHIKNDLSFLNAESHYNTSIAILLGYNDILEKQCEDLSYINSDDFDMDWDFYDYCFAVDKNYTAFRLLLNSNYKTTKLDEMQYNPKIVYDKNIILDILNHMDKYSDDIDNTIEYCKKVTPMLKIKE